MKLSLLFFSALSSVVAFAQTAMIPDRPEKLSFPPLTYTPPSAADYRIALKSGPVAYVVPDRELPLVSVSVYVRTGKYLVPEGKEGLEYLTGEMLTKGGAGRWSAEELDEKADFLAARFSGAISDLYGAVSLNILAKDLDEGLEMLRASLAEPRFQKDKVLLTKMQMLAAMKQRNDDSADIEEREMSFLGFGENFFLNRYVTASSLDSISEDDLREFHRRSFFPSNFVVAASGQFDPGEMASRLERVFASWPVPSGKPLLTVPTDVTFAKPGTYLINKDVNQGRVSIILPGLLRHDPQFFAGLVMNDILGGGGFTSHLMGRIRSDEGLAYSVSSQLPPGVYFPQLFFASFQSKSRTVPYALGIVIEEMKKMTEQLVTETELEDSKRGFIERLPRYFATKTQVATLFAQDELTGRFARDPEFWLKFRERVERVSRQEVKEVARRLLEKQKPAVLIVGLRDDILKGHPSYSVDLAKEFGPITELPLRDPLTMKPLPAR